MRIHRLEIQAFGPFAGRECVDFDALGAQGLFLLNGSTGAGKTSVLDAVAYALYGQVPGARNGAVKRLRSHHAADGVGPEVVCEFSAGGRRLEVRRSPEWMRPAKRGSGTTREQASTQLREKVDGSWVPLSQRNDEAASEIQRLLGMNMEQFTKVILLAQGEFAAFLRASAKDREELLEKLFGTEIYQDVELRLAADARDAAAGVADGMARLAGHEALARTQSLQVLETSGLLDEETGETPDDAVDGDAANAEVAHAGLDSSGTELFDWLAESIATAQRQLGDAVADAEQRNEQAVDALAAAEQRHGRHAVRDAALAEQARLASLAPDADGWRESMKRHREAEVLAAVVAAADKTAASLDNAGKRVRAATEGFAANALATALAGEADAADPTLAALGALDQDLSGQLATVAAAEPGEQRLVKLAAELAAGELALAKSAADVAAHQGAQSDGQARLAEIRTELAVLRADAVPLPQARERHGSARELVDSILAHTSQAETVGTLAAADLASREAALAAKGSWLDAVELRLSLAAGELAATLVDGEPCQVCGSTVHPAPSTLAGSGADAVQAEKKAKAAHREAETNAEAALAGLSRARQELAVLAERGGGKDLAQARADVELAKEGLDAAMAADARLAELAADSEATETAVARAQEALLAASAQVASLTASNGALAQETGQLADGLLAARAGYDSLARRSEAIAAARQVIGDLQDALRRRDSAETAGTEAADALALALAGGSFADAAAVRDARLAAGEAAAVQERLDDYGRAGTLNTAQLNSADVAAAAVEAGKGIGAPTAAQLEELRSASRGFAAAARAAAVQLALARNAGEQLAETRAAFERSEASVAPLRERAALLGGLADAVRGAGENQLKMTLTSYVLAARLEQVAMAASARLSTMSGARYTLSHTDARAGGNRKSGLGLEVVDEWTQLSRDTSTLSGGESFMASLSLALGLADVVQQESGGLDIETLFVDEGFGSLDDESLDQVMDALEGLRDGGRVVGLVSHVADMKTRIPMHLHVTKGRNGSTLSLGQAG
ncbi:hypothetical protein AL755_15435 [Arthrobacter sp. ERGS1:01]|uniref:AAA family ATPase n=1 Tax=Arthrobacter sp. ERGS1:01 TaxID=1704044 RepID=UPI0006B61275|nr:AAA family ATPase [Arthrobacter sp. ERGS1:01]ALE06524.1 hypothetical protein AL755_15435 [Arthrobacter sp. ERGS1:01]